MAPHTCCLSENLGQKNFTGIIGRFFKPATPEILVEKYVASNYFTYSKLNNVHDGAYPRCAPNTRMAKIAPACHYKRMQTLPSSKLFALSVKTWRWQQNKYDLNQKIPYWRGHSGNLIVKAKQLQHSDSALHLSRLRFTS